MAAIAIPIPQIWRIVVYVRDTAEKPFKLRLTFPDRTSASNYAWEVAQQLSSTKQWLTPRDFEDDPVYLRYVPAHAVDEIAACLEGS